MTQALDVYVSKRPAGRDMSKPQIPPATPSARGSSAARRWLCLLLLLAVAVAAGLLMIGTMPGLSGSRSGPQAAATSAATSAASAASLSATSSAIFPASANLLANPGFDGAGAAANGSGSSGWAPAQPLGYAIAAGGRSGNALSVDRTSATAGNASGGGGGASQTVTFNPPSARPLFVSAYSSMQSASRFASNPAPADYCVRLDVAYVDGTNGSMVLPFATGNHGWQLESAYFWPAYVYGQPGQAKALTSATVSLVFANSLSGIAAFDDVSLRVAYSAPLSHSPHPAGTKLLLYSALNPAYAADTASSWRARGFSGFIFDHGGAVAVDDPYALADVTTFRSAIGRLAAAGITDSFLSISIRDHQPALSSFTDVFNDAAWDGVAAGLGRFARYARTTGLRGLVLDSEPYGTGSFLADPGDQMHTQKLLGDTVQARGRQVMQAIIAEYPQAVIILLPQLTDAPRYKFYTHFFAGVCSVNGPRDIIVGDEREYSMWLKNPPLDALGWARGVEVNFARIAGVPDWNVDTNLALGTFPLGWYRQIPSAQDPRWYYGGKAEIFGDAKLPPGAASLRGSSYYNKSAYAGLTADAYFYQQAAYRQAFPDARYQWVYGHGGAWYQLTDARYGPDGSVPPQNQADGRTPLPWVYRNANRFRFGEQPTDPFIDYFAWVTGYWFGG